MKKFGSGLVKGVFHVGVKFSMDFLLLVLCCFDRIGVGVEFLLGQSPSEVGMVTPSKGCVNGMFSGSVIYTGIIPGVFVLVVIWFVRGAKHI